MEGRAILQGRPEMRKPSLQAGLLGGLGGRLVVLVDTNLPPTRHPLSTENCGFPNGSGLPAEKPPNAGPNPLF